MAGLLVLATGGIGLEGAGAQTSVCERPGGSARICPIEELRVGGEPIDLTLAFLGPGALLTERPQIIVGRGSGVARIYAPRPGDGVDYGAAGTLDAGFDALEAVEAFESGTPRPPGSAIPDSRSAPDLVAMLGTVRRESDRLALFSGIGPPAQVFGLGDARGASFASADLDGNGAGDMLVSTPATRRVRVFLAGPGGVFGELPPVRLPTSRVSAIAARDFNGDGDPGPRGGV